MKTVIVILNWNGEKLLPRFLPSVLETGLLAGAHVVVADNGSTDASVDILRNQFPQVTTIELETNYGFAKGYNETLKRLEADYFVILNSDVEVPDGWLQPLVKMLDENKSVAAVQPKILSYNNKEYFEYAGAAGGFIDRYGFPFCRGRVMEVLEKDEGQYDQPVDIFWGSGACLVVRAAVFHEAGGFDEDFWAHMEEIDLCWRMKNMGFRIVYCPDSKVYHLGGGSLPYGSPRKLYLNFRNNLSLLYKNLPRQKIVPTLFVRMLFDGLAALHLLDRLNVRGFYSVLRAHGSFYRSLPVLRSKRRAQKNYVTHAMHPEMYGRSMILDYYLRGRKRFSDLFF